ncbi:MAG: TRAP transporter small permease [Elusimicrobiota bacterium]|jgi:TRAP-type C4-dicarboxylate transport system permease small subunit|nr:TRAP transporter small permease [Elusimicrobiota bacterium]
MIKILGKIENAFLVCVFTIMVIAAFLQVVNRNLIGANISWFEELARYCMVYMTLIATELGLRDGSQISITAFTDKLPQFLRKGLSLFAKLVVIIFSALVCVYSIPVLKVQASAGQVSPGLQIPMTIPYFAIPLSFGIIAIVQSVIFVSMIYAFVKNAPQNVKEAK